MSRFSIKTTQARIALLVGVLALTAALNAVIGIVNAAAVQQQLAELESYSGLLEQHANARASVLKQQIAVRGALLSPEYWTKEYSTFTQAQSQFDDYIVQMQMEYEGDELLADQESAHQALGQNIEAVFSGVEDLEAAQPETLQADLDRIDESVETLESIVQASNDYDAQNLRSQIAAIQKRAQLNLLVGQMALLALAGLIIWGVYTTQNLTAPIDSLTSAIVAFENNSYSPDLLAREVNRPDELGQLSRAVGNMAQSISESNRLKEQFLKSAQRFIPEQYLDFLEKDSITKVNLGDHVSAEMAVMFSDIRGFTSMSEKMTAQENFDFVNEYLKLVSPIIQKYEGFIVKFLGDGMMAIFPYGVEDAVRAGIEKGLMVQQFNQRLQARGLPPVSVGIGIHTGPMMVGMIGEEMRMQGDAFSDNVNLTSRIEGLNKFYGTSMIISEDTLRQLPQPLALKMRYLGKALVKGRITPLGMYEVYDGLGSAEAALRDATRLDFAQALESYIRGEFAKAGQGFNQVLEKNPQDKTARFYLESCAEHLDRPVPGGWDGTIVMDAK